MKENMTIKELLNQLQKICVDGHGDDDITISLPDTDWPYARIEIESADGTTFLHIIE